MMRLTSLTKRLFLAALLLTLSRASAQEPPTPTPLPAPGLTLVSVQARGEVNCGVNQSLLGFGYLDPNTGEVRGLEVDLCRALAVAIFSDTNAVNLVLYDTESKGLAALAAGDIDVLMRNVVWGLTLDAVPGMTFGPVIFYSGQSMIVNAAAGLDDWPNLDGHSICIVGKSVAEANLGRVMAVQGLTYQPVVVSTPADAQTAFTEGRCDAYSADRVLLEIFRQGSPDPAAYRVWQGETHIYTDEAYAPLYRSGDDQWENIVNWTMLGLIEAEQLNISSETVTGLLRVTNETDATYLARVTPAVASMLDSNLGLGINLGLKRDFMVAVLREVGNYGEIYQRYFGPQGDLPLERGPNRLARDGGLIYAPDWR